MGAAIHKSNGLGIEYINRDHQIEVEHKNDLSVLRWTSFEWFRHKNKARLLFAILFLLILMLSYLIYTTINRNGITSDHSLLPLIAIDIVLIVVLTKCVASHSTFPFKSLNKHKYHFTGRAALKRQLETQNTKLISEYKESRNSL